MIKLSNGVKVAVLVLSLGSISAMGAVPLENWPIEDVANKIPDGLRVVCVNSLVYGAGGRDVLVFRLKSESKKPVQFEVPRFFILSSGTPDPFEFVFDCSTRNSVDSVGSINGRCVGKFLGKAPNNQVDSVYFVTGINPETKLLFADVRFIGPAIDYVKNHFICRECTSNDSFCKNL